MLSGCTRLVGRKSFGGVPERSKGSDCKSDGYAFEGSNPSPATIKEIGVLLFLLNVMIRSVREKISAGMVQW